MSTRTVEQQPEHVPSTNGQVHANGEPKKPFKPRYPLRSFEDTKQNAVCIAFIMGLVFAFGLTNASKLFSTEELAQGTGARFLQAVRNPRLGVYISLLVVFHMAEYLTTAIFNPDKVNVRSFLLEDQNHNAAHAFAFCEFLLEETFLSERWLAYKRGPMLVLVGFVVTLAAQYLRSLAMITAASNFSHLIVYDKAPEHSLVRTGIYGWSRHPSYVAFFYWALGTQIFIGNPVAFIGFSFVLYKFFSHRIKVEEWYLVKFFGPDYQRYQKEVPARIPFIR